MYDDIIGYSEQGLWGLISIDNNKISEPLYTGLYPAEEKFLYASVKGTNEKSELYGLIDPKGRVLVDFQYLNLTQHTGMLVASKIIAGMKRSGVLSFERKNGYSHKIR